MTNRQLRTGAFILYPLPYIFRIMFMKRFLRRLCGTAGTDCRLRGSNVIVRKSKAGAFFSDSMHRTSTVDAARQERFDVRIHE